MFQDWLSEFLYENFHITYNDSVKMSNFYVGELSLTPAEAAYLLAKFSEYFNLPLTELLDNMEDFSCNELVLAANKIGEKDGKNSNN